MTYNKHPLQQSYLLFMCVNFIHVFHSALHSALPLVLKNAKCNLYALVNNRGMKAETLGQIWTNEIAVYHLSTG